MLIHMSATPGLSQNYVLDYFSLKGSPHWSLTTHFADKQPEVLIIIKKFMSFTDLNKGTF